MTGEPDQPTKLNRAERRKQKRRKKASKKLRMENRQEANAVMNKFAERWKQCKTEEERQSFIDSLTAEERREMANAKAYMQMQAFSAYANLPEDTRAELKKGNVSVLRG